MTFSDDIDRHRQNVRDSFRAVFIEATDEVQRSITDGSLITGAPGQPVQTGALKGSWVPRFLDPWLWRTTTNLDYAQSIEDGRSYAHGGGPMTLRSTVGGFHSVKLTRAGWQRIVEAVGLRRASDVREIRE